MGDQREVDPALAFAEHAFAEHAFAEHALGPIAGWRIERAGTDHRVLALEACSGRRAHLKQHREGRQHEQERRAYEQWAPRLAGRAPRLIAAAPALRAILIDTAPGLPLAQHVLPPERERAAHEEAGRALASLHGLASTTSDPDPVPLERALAERARAVAARARRARALAPAEIEAVIAPALEPGLFAGLLRVPCHRDFQPDNWVVEAPAAEPGPSGPAPGLDAAAPSPSGAGGAKGPALALRVIDFGHARLDAALVDFVKLAAGAWRGRVDLEDAFWAGYGGAPDVRGRRQIEALVGVHALATFTWGRVHRAPRFEREGADLLAHLAPCCGRLAPPAPLGGAR